MHDDSSIDLERVSQSSIDTDKREQTPEKQVHKTSGVFSVCSKCGVTSFLLTQTFQKR